VECATCKDTDIHTDASGFCSTGNPVKIYRGFGCQDDWRKQYNTPSGDVKEFSYPFEKGEHTHFHSVKRKTEAEGEDLFTRKAK